MRITTKKPLRSLLVPKRRGNGRNNQGRITTRHKGGGAKKFYRIVNFKLARRHNRHHRAHRIRSEPQRPHRPYQRT